MSTPRKINTILLNIKVNAPKLVNMCECKLAKFCGCICSLNENIAQSYRGREGTFLTHTVDSWPAIIRPPKSMLVVY